MTAAAADVPAVTDSSNINSNVSNVQNRFVREWIQQSMAMLRPDKVYYCNGSKEERESLYAQGVNDERPRPLELYPEIRHPRLVGIQGVHEPVEPFLDGL